jgi:hypothetical protein
MGPIVGISPNTMCERLTTAQIELAGEMHQISEEGYCAGWVRGLEFRLWKILSEGPCEFGGLELTGERLARLRALSDACGGWIAWDQSLKDRKFIPLHEWHTRFAEWESRQS